MKVATGKGRGAGSKDNNASKRVLTLGTPSDLNKQNRIGENLMTETSSVESEVPKCQGRRRQLRQRLMTYDVR